MSAVDMPLPGVELRLGGGTVRVLDQGAQVIDWTPAGSAPVLFASAAASYEPGRHVRAGAPLIFPWFGLGRRGDRTPVHGYARLRPFQRAAAETGADSASVRHWLVPEQSDDLPAKLEATTTMRARSLSIALTVTNLAGTPISYDIGLHTYLAVGDLRRASLEGLGGCRYLDRVCGVTEIQEASALTIDSELDRAYRHPGSVTVDDPVRHRRLRIDKRGSGTTIVWNPGPDKARDFADLGDDEWRGLLCVEAANIGDDAVVLPPGGRHTLEQSIHIEQR